MKDKYPEYYAPTREEFQELWNESHFVFDSNTLLNLYMYTEDTVEDYWKIFQELQDRLWLSYQAGLELHRNRPSRIIEQENLFDQTISTLNTIAEDAHKILNKHFENIREHPSIDEEKIIAETDDFFKSLEENISSKKKDYPNHLEGEDKIINKLTLFFEGSIGDKFSKDELRDIYEEGKQRYSKGIPPGFEDEKNKDGERMYGDLVIWKEILKFAKSEDVKSIIFVTNDLKRDWWHIKSGRTIGPHPKLIKEFNDETGKGYYQYNSEMFLKIAKDRLVEIDEKSIEETKRVSEHMSEHFSIGNMLSSLSQDDLDLITGRSSIGSLLNNLSKEELDRITGRGSIGSLLNNLSKEELNRITGRSTIGNMLNSLSQEDSKSKEENEEQLNQTGKNEGEKD